MRRRDYELLDAIEAIDPVDFEGSVWRTAREGNDPCRCSRSGGRWDDGSFDILYTSETPDGAIAERYFHLKRGQPVFPSRPRYRLHEISCRLNRALRLVDMAALERLGVDSSKYGRLSYQERTVEYPRTQDIGEAAHFLGFDGLIVPSARWNCRNVVLFCDEVPPEAYYHVEDHNLIDWDVWVAANKGSLPA